MVSPKFSAPPSGETMRRTPKVLEVQERAQRPLSPCQIWWGSDVTRHRGGQKRLVLLSVRITLLCRCMLGGAAVASEFYYLFLLKIVVCNFT